MSPQDPSNPSSTPAQLRSKLGTYLSGVAIGFTMLGIIYFFKHQATQRQQAQGQAQIESQDEPEQGDGQMPRGAGEPAGAQP